MKGIIIAPSSFPWILGLRVSPCYPKSPAGKWLSLGFGLSSLQCPSPGSCFYITLSFVLETNGQRTTGVERGILTSDWTFSLHSSQWLEPAPWVPWPGKMRGLGPSAHLVLERWRCPSPPYLAWLSVPVPPPALLSRLFCCQVVTFLPQAVVTSTQVPSILSAS